MSLPSRFGAFGLSCAFALCRRMQSNPKLVVASGWNALQSVTLNLLFNGVSLAPSGCFLNGAPMVHVTGSFAWPRCHCLQNDAATELSGFASLKTLGSGMTFQASVSIPEARHCRSLLSLLGAVGVRVWLSGGR